MLPAQKLRELRPQLFGVSEKAIPIPFLVGAQSLAGGPPLGKTRESWWDFVSNKRSGRGFWTTAPREAPPFDPRDACY